MNSAEPSFDVLAGARKAASVIVLRDRPDGAGLEVLMLRRAERDGDMRSGAAVFPGGVLDARDRDAHRYCEGWDDARASQRLGLPDGGLDYWVAAVRECLEEVGLLYAHANGQPFDASAWRDPLQQGECGLAELCEQQGLTLELKGWHYWSHWLTPPGNPKRFDTRFFVAEAPPGQLALADGGEAVELMWLTPSEALARERGLKLLPVTRRTLEELGRHGTVASVLAHAAQLRDIPLTMPRLASTRHPKDGSLQRTVVLPEEASYAEVGHLDPAGRGDALNQIVPGRPVRLTPRLIRVTAPNPGVMTGPGTNSYLVGDPVTNRWTVIDPGPALPVHTQALLAAAPGPIERILVTHTHADHSPGAQALREATGAPVLGQRPAYRQGQDPHFSPDNVLQGGERLVLGPSATLDVLHTPGHASNHLCYWLPEDGLLLTGDHVMQGSTVVINPPDGDMAAYCASLRGLLSLPLRWLAPGHGFLVAQPHAVIEALLAHRQRREDRVLRALAEADRAAGGASAHSLAALVAWAYDDTPVALHPLAQRSLLAHLLKLHGEGRAVQHEEGDHVLWRQP
jgi:glyoxylase-like metal-dependent hydrolase (beta-lactamase superfamily II)/8-oxo-dGTP pyrophosphatase MutT (NUDIX family)